MNITYKIILMISIMMIIFTTSNPTILHAQRFVEKELVNGNENLQVSVNSKENITDVYEVWQNQARIENTTNILIRVSNDGGDTYSTHKLLSNYTESSSPLTALKSYNPQIDSTNNLVVVVWQALLTDGADTVSHIFSVNSTDKGKTFTKPIDLTANYTTSFIEPHVFVDNNEKVLISYMGDDGPVDTCRKHCG